MLNINDLFHFSEERLQKGGIKIRFLVKAGDVDPLEEYRLDPVKTAHDWTLWYNVKKPLRVGDTVLTFVRMEDPDLWLFITAKKVVGDDGMNHFIGEDVHDFDGYVNRLVVRYKNRSQNLVRRYSKIMQDMYVHQILDNDYTGQRFPGYSKVNISFKRLRDVIRRRLDSWITGLSNMKAVYLITDVKSNKLYIGSATSGNGMLLGRWTQYVETGHGGNIEFKKLSYEYMQDNFRFSILEVFTPNTSDDEILVRESEYKDRLRTRQSGYNKN